jgi:hypothetical protein
MIKCINYLFILSACYKSPIVLQQVGTQRAPSNSPLDSQRNLPRLNCRLIRVLPSLANSKNQRDRIYDDLGLGSEPLRMDSMSMSSDQNDFK